MRLNLNIQCAMTTSFLRRDYQLKDNRMLPLAGPEDRAAQTDKTPYIPADYLHETFPVAVVEIPPTPMEAERMWCAMKSPSPHSLRRT